MAASDGHASRRLAMVAIVVAVALWAGTLLPSPWGRHERELLRMVRAPAVELLITLMASWVAWCALQARRADLMPARVPVEEPLEVAPDLMTCHGRSPVVVLVGLQQGAGVTTLAFNLAVCLALRAARPICLLAEGPLTRALGLDPQPLDDLVTRRPYRVGPEVVNVAVRHASGCELLCLASSGRGIDNIRPLVSELSRHYDAVLLDGGCGGRSVVDISVDIAEALLLVALPTGESVETAGRWIEWVYSHSIEGKTALILNRVPAWPSAPLALRLAFLHYAQLPFEPSVAALDHGGVPWAADGRLCAARTLIAVTRQLFPMLTSEDDLDAA